ncbi:MAG: peptidoglycan DD-metalloendopeptidase family protein [Anaerolineales bacterium]
MNRHFSPIGRVFIALVVFFGLSGCNESLWGEDDPWLSATPESFWTVVPTSLAITPPETPTPTPFLAETSTPSGPTSTPAPPLLYYTQSGDSLPVVAAHFGVTPADISSSLPLSPTGLLDPAIPLVIPNRLDGVACTPSAQVLPDSEVVYSPTAIDFDVEAYVVAQGGYLSDYREYLASVGWVDGAQAVEKSAIENSINPRLLLALLEYQAGWVRGQPTNLLQTDYPLGYSSLIDRGLFQQLRWASEQLMLGYYGWRGGTLTELHFPDGSTLRLAPDLNAGTVALMYYFSQNYNYDEWLLMMDARVGFAALYTEMFGDPWLRAAAVEPLFPPGLTQPALSLPFEPGQIWSFSGGPHPAWNRQGALAALDFAPPSTESGCQPSDAWVLASAPGRVVRAGNGVVVLDLDGDGYEQTGWNLLYLHVATLDRVQVGTWVEADGRIGHPSCEGGMATGTHVHFARKYNGEWVLADGPLPFTLSGWVAHNGEAPYQGTLTRGDEVVIARTNGMYDTHIVRQPGE